MERRELQVDDFDDLPDLQIARLERKCEEMMRRMAEQDEELRLLAGILMGLYDDEANAG